MLCCDRRARKNHLAGDFRQGCQQRRYLEISTVPDRTLQFQKQMDRS